MHFDTLNNDFYNEFSENFDKLPFDPLLPTLILKYLPKTPCSILEIGSGAGALASWFTHLDHSVTCIEPAANAAEKARARGLTVHTTRFQDYQKDQNV